MLKSHKICCVLISAAALLTGVCAYAQTPAAKPASSVFASGIKEKPSYDHEELTREQTDMLKSLDTVEKEFKDSRDSLGTGRLYNTALEFFFIGKVRLERVNAVMLGHPARIGKVSGGLFTSKKTFQERLTKSYETVRERFSRLKRLEEALEKDLGGIFGTYRMERIYEEIVKTSGGSGSNTETVVQEAIKTVTSGTTPTGTVTTVVTPPPQPPVKPVDTPRPPVVQPAQPDPSVVIQQKRVAYTNTLSDFLNRNAYGISTLSAEDQARLLEWIRQYNEAIAAGKFDEADRILRETTAWLNSRTSGNTPPTGKGDQQVITDGKSMFIVDGKFQNVRKTYIGSENGELTNESRLQYDPKNLSREPAVIAERNYGMKLELVSEEAVDGGKKVVFALTDDNPEVASKLGGFVQSWTLSLNGAVIASGQSGDISATVNQGGSCILTVKGMTDWESQFEITSDFNILL